MKGQHPFWRHGHYVVVTSIGKRHRHQPSERWEVEVTNPRGRTRLHYRSNLLAVARVVLQATRKPRETR